MKEKIHQAVNDFFSNTVVERKSMEHILTEISKRSITSFRSSYSLSTLRDYIRNHNLQYTVFEVGNELRYYLSINGVSMDYIYSIVSSIDESLNNSIFIVEEELNIVKSTISPREEDNIVLMLLVLRIMLKYSLECFNKTV